MITEKKTSKFTVILGLVIVLLGIIVFTILSVSEFIALKEIKKDGVYVVGKVTSSTSRKGGRSFTFTYFYKEKAYETSLMALSYQYKEGDLKFIRISSSNPSNSMFGDDYPPPSPCITFETQPAEGWKEIPLCK